MIAEKIGSYHLIAQGFRNVNVADPEKTLNDLREAFPLVDIQLLRADRVAGKEHLFFAARNAVDSFEGKGRRAKHLSMEFLLFASGEHQIVEAIKLLGVTTSTSQLVSIGLSKPEPDSRELLTRIEQKVGGQPDDSVFDFRNSKKAPALKRAYKITEKELRSAQVSGEPEVMVLKRLVLERSALLVLEN